MNEARKEILNASKDWIAYTQNSENAREASAAMNEGSTRLVELFNFFGGATCKESWNYRDRYEVPLRFGWIHQLLFW